MQQIIVDKNQAGQRFDKFLHKVLPNAGTGFLYKMLRKKNITLNGKKAEGKEILVLNDTVCFFFSDETFQIFSGTDSNKDNSKENEYLKAYQTLKQIDVIYEDDNVVFLNKPVGVLTQKANPEDISLNEWFIGYLLHKGAIQKETLKSFHPSVCNRLDRNTSGMVLCGKTLIGTQVLSKLIKDRSIKKFYRTICFGSMDETLKLNGYLKKDSGKNKVEIIKEKPKNVEAYDFIQTNIFPLSQTKDYSLLEVELITGKTHQIRAHLASVNHAIIGDFKYGKQSLNEMIKKQYKLNTQLLHAYRIEFPEKIDGELKNLSGKIFIAEYPELFQKLQNIFF